MRTIGILTSSRADFGIYLPLLHKLNNDNDFTIKIIAFGTHLSQFHGYTKTVIEDAGFDIDYTIESILLTDSPSSISSSIGLTTLKFADFWKNKGDEFDLIFCLGDRYEMFAAVVAATPLQLSFAHLHGGETTLGAIDNIFRHAITLAATYHFVATDESVKKVADITGTNKNIYNVGALSLDNLKLIELFTIEEFRDKWSVDFRHPTILVTFHPETVAFEKNVIYTEEVIKALTVLNEYQILITMPNADTHGNAIRQRLIDSFNNKDNMYLVENLGTKDYFTAMKYCSFLLGNTSSGIIEAASFSKYVINLGDRQSGRLSGDNVINIPFHDQQIIAAVRDIEKAPNYTGKNIYYKGGASDAIISTLKKIVEL